MRLPFVVRMAWRESRRGRRRLALYLSAVSLGVAALVAINSFRANVTASVRAQARTLLGADLELRSRAPFPDSVESILDSLARAGVPGGRVTSFGSMVLAPRTGRTRLFEIRAVEGGFPFYGDVATEPPGLWTDFRTARQVLVDPAVLVHLDARVGDTVFVGDARFAIAGVVSSAPGDVGLRTAIGPRVFLPARFLAETNLLRFGSSARYRAYLEIPGELELQRLINRHTALFKRHRVKAQTVAEHEEDLTEALGRLSRYLGLVGLVALFLGGLGVGSAVSVFVKDKLEGAAVLRCLGASSRTVLAIYLVQATALGLAGAGAGALLGLGVQAVLPMVVREFLPLDVAARVSWPAVLAGLAVGVGTAAAFALLPLLHLKDVPPLRALRRDFDVQALPPPSRRVSYIAVVGALIAGIVAVSLWQAPQPAVGFAFAGAILGTTALLWLSARGLMHAARRYFPRRAGYVVRQGIANLFRPQNQTVAVTIALGFGVFLIATLYIVQRNLIDQFAVDSGTDRPNIVLFDIQHDQQAGVAALLATRGVTALEHTALVPARIAAVNGRAASAIIADSARGRPPNRWALRRQYRHTYRDTLVQSEQLVAGAWWRGPRPPGDPARISMERDLAAELQVQVGDRITWNVQGVLVESRIANLRAVSWARFEPNFFVVFEPGVLEQAPQTYVLLAREHDAERRAELQRDIVLAYPNVSALDLTLVQRTLDGVLSQVTRAIRFMALFSIACGLLVLVAALTASRLQRAREAVLLKTLGASGSQIRRVLLTEYVAWGSLAGLSGVLLAGGAGWALTTWFFDVNFRLPAPALALMWLSVCALTALVGFASSRSVLRATPLGAWRDLSE